MSLEQSVEKLQLSLKAPRGEPNIPLRDGLREFAQAEALEYKEDNIGNTYLQTPGTDSGLANIGIAFPLDGCQSSTPFNSAFKVFDQLRQQKLACGLTLMGYTSLDQGTIGRDRWEAAIPMLKNTTSSPMPQSLSKFSERPNPSEFPLSALVEVCEEDSGILSLLGTAILTGKAEKFIAADQTVKKSDRKCPRAPYVLVKGPYAEAVAKGVIAEYSSYVVKLFDNFD